MPQANPYADTERRAQLTQRFLEDVEQLVRSARGGQWPRLGCIEGVDQTGTVQFSIDDDGAFVGVYLDRNWWGALGVTGIGRGLMQAQRDAKAKLAAAHLLFYYRLGEPQRVESDSFEWKHRLTATNDMTDLIGSWRAVTAESYQRIYEYERRRDAGGGVAQEVVNGPDGLVQITLTAGSVTDVKVAAWRLSEQSTDRLVADIRAALVESGGTSDE